MPITPVTTEMLTTDWRSTGYWIDKLSLDVMDSFRKDFRHHPTQGHYFICQMIEKCEMACECLKNDPSHPGLLGLDCEFVNRKPYVEWEECCTSVFNIKSHSDTNSKGPFAVLIQIARIDDHILVFDLFRIGIIPLSVINVLATAMGLVTFTGHSDVCELHHSDHRFTTFSPIIDLQKLWKVIQNGSRIKYICERIAPNFPNGASAQNIFRVAYPTHQHGLTLANLVRDVLLPHVDKHLRGSEMQWASNNLSYE
uniref:3'-5' exonuclease domain-containing protein n=1 Tax=Romanomermis culicivorax TaxID=13658 RepID=A0A915ILI0_ROMCU